MLADMNIYPIDKHERWNVFDCTNLRLLLTLLANCVK